MNMIREVFIYNIDSVKYYVNGLEIEFLNYKYTPNSTDQAHRILLKAPQEI